MAEWVGLASLPSGVHLDIGDVPGMVRASGDAIVSLNLDELKTGVRRRKKMPGPVREIPVPAPPAPRPAWMDHPDPVGSGLLPRKPPGRR